MFHKIIVVEEFNSVCYVYNTLLQNKLETFYHNPSFVRLLYINVALVELYMSRWYIICFYPIKSQFGMKFIILIWV